MGAELAALQRFDEAIASYEAALRIRPEFPEALVNLGNALDQTQQTARAIECYEKALVLAPNLTVAHYNLSAPLLRSGRLQQGWAEYEWRLKSNLLQPLPQMPRWSGEPLDGKTILLLTEQGLGDTLQFSRYARLVKNLGARVVLRCQPPLVSLMKTCLAVDEVVPDDAEDIEAEFYAPLMSLPHHFGTTLETVPTDGPYLWAREELVEDWRATLSRWEGFKIGVSWQANPRQDRLGLRSFTLPALEPISKLSGIQLVSLQQKDGLDQLGEFGDRLSIVDLGPNVDTQNGPFVDTAAIMHGLDLVISCDSAVAHLAGALGIETWLALPTYSDWRWLSGRDDSPWYPTTRLFRQQRPGDWSSVFASMAGCLEEKRAN